MKRKSPRTYQESNFSSPRSAKQLGESFSTNEMTFELKLKKTSVHYVNLKQAKEKLDTELLFLNKRCQHS